MKKTAFLLIGIPLIVISCSKSFHVAGNFGKELKSQTVELTEPNCKGGDFLLSSPMNPDGSFELTGDIAPGKVGFIEFKKDYIRLPVYINSEDYMLTEKDGEYYIRSEEPNSLQNKYVEYLQEQRRLNKEYDEMSKGYCEMEDILEKAKLSEELDKKFNEKNITILAGMKEFAGTEIAQNILNDILYYCEVDYKFFTRAIEALGHNTPESKMKERIFNAYETCKARQLTGAAPEFKLPDASGKMVSLSSFRGKYVLVDFWASWCAPCRKKNKELNNHYDELKSNGLEVISISLDDKKDLWLEAVKTDNIRWTQLADLAGFKNSAVRAAYKIEQVPSVFLIDKEGNIAATNPDMNEIKAITQN